MIYYYHQKAIEVLLDLGWLSTTVPAALYGGVVVVG
jgi:hypothetical protein